MAAGNVKYVAVRDHLSERIARMSPGDQLATEATLCAEYNVSRITVRRAVDDLIREGRLVREQGRGTFVTSPVYVQHVRERFSERVTGFHRQQSVLGREVSTVVLQSRVIRRAEAATALGMNPADELIELERLRYVDGALHQHVVTYLPADRFPGVLDQDLTHGSLYDYLETTYGVVLARNDLLVRLDRASDHVAEVLGVEPGARVLTIDSTVFTADDSAVAYGTARHTPANSEIAFSLRNRSNDNT